MDDVEYFVWPALLVSCFIVGILIGVLATESTAAYKIGQAVVEECGKPEAVCEYEYFNGDNDE
jgi:hypothetical protein